MRPGAPSSTGTYLLLLLAFVLGFLAIWADPSGSTASEEVGVGTLLGRPADYWGRSVRVVGSVTRTETRLYELTDRTGETVLIRTRSAPKEGAEVLVVTMVGQDPNNALRPLLIELERDNLRRSLESVLLAVALVLLASVVGMVLVVRADRHLRRFAVTGVDPGEPPPGVAPLLQLQVVEGPDRGKVFEFDQPEVLIGRPGERPNGVSLSDLTISRSQGRIVRHGGGFRFENESATNPTRINGQSVQKAELLNGDRLEMGDTVLRIALVAREGVPA